MNRKLVFELATARFVTQHEDALFLGPPGSGKSHLAQPIGLAVIQQGYRVLYREAHVLLEELADAPLAGERKLCIERFATVPLLIIDDLAGGSTLSDPCYKTFPWTRSRPPLHRSYVRSGRLGASRRRALPARWAFHSPP